MHYIIHYVKSSLTKVKNKNHKKQVSAPITVDAVHLMVILIWQFGNFYYLAVWQFLLHCQI